MTKPDRSRRPKLVTWAYRCWMAAGVLLVVLGIVGEVGVVLDVSGASILAPMALNVVVIAVGVAILMMGTKAYLGDLRWRSSLAALTLVVVAMLLLLSIGFGAPLLAVQLLAAIVGLFGSLLAYRPVSDAWFDPEGAARREAQAATKAKRKKR